MMIGPYELNQIYCGECSEQMSHLPVDSVDLTVTSPPYGNLRSYNGYIFPFVAIAHQLYRVTKPGGVVVWVVADETKNGSESGESFKQALFFMSRGFNLHDTMIYEVMGTGAKGSNKAYWQAFEYMFVFSKGEPKTVNRIKDVVNKRAGTVCTKGRIAANGQEKDTRRRVVPKYSVRTNIWRYQAGNNGDDYTDHEAPFPEALARDHILSWSNPGDLVLDPMCGSGTVPKMCALTDRGFIGFDISEEYCQIARERVARVMAQPKLFPFQTQEAPASYGKIDTGKSGYQVDLPLFQTETHEKA